MTKNEILTFLREKKSYLVEQYGVTSIGLFGSYARDEAGDDSDIDIAVELQSKNKFMNFFNLKYYLEEHFKKSIDIGIESALKPIAKEYIDKDIIYA
jgi:predicted nucleotidyltransferase